MNLQFGMLWPFRNPEWARVAWDDFYRCQLDLIVESEQLGFDHVWLTEHHFVDDGYSPSLFPIGAAVAARTSRIRIGTFLLLLPLHNPVRVAEDTRS
ncbi:LLM class flavin-dependent oxidoreductase, partial [Mycolicibacterium diernhoferi]